jgi:hypothetical protein
VRWPSCGGRTSACSPSDESGTTVLHGFTGEWTSIFYILCMTFEGRFLQ